MLSEYNVYDGDILIMYHHVMDVTERDFYVNNGYKVVFVKDLTNEEELCYQ